MECRLTQVDILIPLGFAFVFLLLALITCAVVDKRKKERQHLGQPYYMKIDLVYMILAAGVMLSVTVVTQGTKYLMCMGTLTQ